ncbi:NAD(P)/FAD-dependent oxidoreductase [Fontimonas sp. SYSU GA230001]|uniref:phytoene desaturase family protein n=1 Tax=Fontimonas sp. SYSU GA230001 TaxID=3142450 RepID=UPI0032B4FE3D
MQLRDAHDYDPTWMTKARVKRLPPNRTDVAIVGAGLGGLTAGAVLAQAGIRVAVFDQHYVAGGCCTQFSRGGPRQRYNFDIGLHYIGDCGPDGKIPQILGGLGIDLPVEPMDADGFDILVFPDFRFPIPVGRDRFRDRFVQMFPRERRGIDRYVRFLREIDELLGRVDRNKGRMSWGIAWHAFTRGRLANKYRNATLKDLLDSCSTDPQVRAVMAGQNGDYGLPPSRVSASLHAGLSNHYFHGAYYPRGGGQTIADRLSAYIEAHGGSVHLRREVARILVEDGRAVGVRTRDHKGTEHEVRAPAVLSNADLRVTLEQLLPADALPAQWRERSRNFEMAAAIFMTCLGIRGDMRERGMNNANYWQFDGYDFESFYDTARDMTPRGAYITSATLKDPTTTHHAPAGISSVEAMTVLSGKPEHWGLSGAQAQQQACDWDYKNRSAYLDLKSRIEQDLIGRVDALFPGSRAAIEFCESASPMSHIRYTRATDGTGYGLAATPQQFFEHRPGYSGPLPGLYFAGASTRAGHGVLGAMLSGQRCARRIARELGAPLPA